jgi:ribonuclease Z
VNRELVVLGTASQVPTRQRAHNGYLLRWDGMGILFDPGEGAQRQLLLAGNSASDIHRICVTHFHGDHCLGLPGIIQRLSLDRVRHEVPVHFPASGEVFFDRLRNATVFHDTAIVAPRPISADGVLATGPFGTLSARRLNHPVESYGYRLTEPDGLRMLPERLARLGVAGPDIATITRTGSVRVNGRQVTLAEVSTPRPGQVVAFVMDTGICAAAVELAAGADLLVIESTFLTAQAALAAEAGHLTAAQAGQIATTAGVRKLVLTHFSQRYPDASLFGAEAAAHFDGEIVVAEELARIAVPARR